MSKELRFVSFDPASYRNLGCAVGTITSQDGLSVNVAASTFVLNGVSDEPWTALWPLFVIVDQVFEQNRPDVVIIEKTSSFSGGFITGQVSNCLGVILAVCGKHEVEVEFVYPTHVKKVVTGSGKASKKQIRIAVTSLLKNLNCVTKFDSEHAYDAVANVLTFMHESDEIDYKIQQ